MCCFLCFELFFPRPVELHVAGRQKKHRGSSGGLPCGSHPEDLQIPAAAEGECCAFSHALWSCHILAPPHAGHHPAISSIRPDPLLARGLLVPTHLRFTSSAAPHRSINAGPVIASANADRALSDLLLFVNFEVEK